MLFLSGCSVALKRQRINVDRFKSPDDFASIIKKLRIGMSETEVAEAFGCQNIGEIPNATEIAGAKIYGYLCGNAINCDSQSGQGIKMPLAIHYRAFTVPLRDAKQLLSPDRRGGVNTHGPRVRPLFRPDI